MRSSRTLVLATLLGSMAAAACDQGATEPQAAPELAPPAAPSANLASSGCKSDERSIPDVTVFHNHVNHDLSDYGVIFEEANNTACVDAAATALYKKVKATIESGVFPTQDGNVNRQVYAYQGWLQGANVSLIYATALRLGARGKLTKPLDDLLGRIVYPGYIDYYCGFDNGQWVTQNSCMEDYAIAASAWAWRAAYSTKRGRSAQADADSARVSIRRAVSSDRSICIYKTGPASLYTPIPSRGPCIGGLGDIMFSNGEPLALHNGDAMPYGIGIVTSIASAAVGLSQTAWPLVLDSDEKSMLTYLLSHSRRHTATDGSTFLNDCWRFRNDNGTLVATADYECREPGYGTYLPKMFPVKAFYDKYAPGGFQVQYDFSQFDPTLFCDNWSEPNCTFWMPGRRVVYGTLAKDWTLSTPALSGTLSNYGSYFRTYGGRYLSAAGGGGSSMNAIPTTAGLNEKLSMVDLNGGALMSGDQVQLQSKSGHWAVAEDGGNSVMNVNRAQPHEWETFVLVKASGATGQIYSGEAVALRSWNGYYVVAENGGGGAVNANRLGIGPWETFTLTFTRGA